MLPWLQDNVTSLRFEVLFQTHPLKNRVHMTGDGIKLSDKTINSGGGKI